MLLTQCSKSSRVLFSCKMRPRQLSSLVSRAPQFVIASSRWTQPKRSYGAEILKTVEELRDMTLNVLKLFDKVDPTKVRVCL